VNHSTINIQSPSQLLWSSAFSRVISGTVIVTALILSVAGTSWAHGIAGNRYFPGTLTFDDPAVADELFMPLYDHLEHPTREGGEAIDDAFSVTFLRLLTPRLAIGGDATWLRRARDEFSTRTGFGGAHLLIKGLGYENDPHETLISASFIWGIGGFGTKAVGGYGPNTLQPSITFGRGLGDLPDTLKWLRPFAIDQRKNEHAALRSEQPPISLWIPAQSGYCSVGVRPRVQHFVPYQPF
jgi:hypothetical protein